MKKSYDTRKRILALYEQGLTYKAIAEQIGCSLSNVEGHIYRARAGIPSSKMSLEDRLAQVTSLRNQGKTYEEIASEAGITVARVYQLLGRDESRERKVRRAKAPAKPKVMLSITAFCKVCPGEVVVRVPRTGASLDQWFKLRTTTATCEHCGTMFQADDLIDKQEIERRYWDSVITDEEEV